MGFVMLTNDDRGGRGKNYQKFADVICERPLIMLNFVYVVKRTFAEK